MRGRIEVLASRGERAIQDEIAAARARATFVLIDLEGSASRLTSFAIAESDLVVVPSGDEQQDADEAIETLAQIDMEGRARRREVPAAILFARTNAAVKSKLERHINGQLRGAARVFATELHRRTAFSSLHNAGGGLRQLNRAEVNGVEKAIANAQAFAAEVIDMLEGVPPCRGRLIWTDFGSSRCVPPRSIEAMRLNPSRRPRIGPRPRRSAGRAASRSATGR